MGSEDGQGMSRLRILWELLIFAAAVVSVTAVAIELTVELDPETAHQLHIIDVAALSLFLIDIIWKYRAFHGTGLSFVRGNWLDILAVIPLFRVFRIGRFARLARVARISRLTKATKAAKVTEAAKVGELAKASHVVETAKVGELSKAGRITEAGEKAHKGVAGVSHGRHVEHGIQRKLKGKKREDGGG